jgi:hypothetical protein
MIMPRDLHGFANKALQQARAKRISAVTVTDSRQTAYRYGVVFESFRRSANGRPATVQSKHLKSKHLQSKHQQSKNVQE